MSVPEITRNAVTEPYWRALAEGRLDIQRCTGCGATWLPARAQCPNCLDPGTEWVPSAGRGRVLSWVVYHKAYAPHLAERLPYNIALVELDEGPRILTNIVDSPDGSALRVGSEVVLTIEKEFGMPLPRFRLADPGAST